MLYQLQDTLQNLHSQLQSGILSVTTPPPHNGGKLFLKNGDLIYCEVAPQRDLLGRVLVQLGVLREEENTIFLSDFEHGRDTGAHQSLYGQYLVDKGVLRRDLLFPLLNLQVMLRATSLLVQQASASNFAPKKADMFKDIPLKVTLQDAATFIERLLSNAALPSTETAFFGSQVARERIVVDLALLSPGFLLWFLRGTAFNGEIAFLSPKGELLEQLTYENGVVQSSRELNNRAGFLRFLAQDRYLANDEYQTLLSGLANDVRPIKTLVTEHLQLFSVPEFQRLQSLYWRHIVFNLLSQVGGHAVTGDLLESFLRETSADVEPQAPWFKAFSPSTTARPVSYTSPNGLGTPSGNATWGRAIFFPKHQKIELHYNHWHSYLPYHQSFFAQEPLQAPPGANPTQTYTLITVRIGDHLLGNFDVASRPEHAFVLKPRGKAVFRNLQTYAKEILARAATPEEREALIAQWPQGVFDRKPEGKPTEADPKTPKAPWKSRQVLIAGALVAALTGAGVWFYGYNSHTAPIDPSSAQEATGEDPAPRYRGSDIRSIEKDSNGLVWLVLLSQERIHVSEQVFRECDRVLQKKINTIQRIK